MADFGLLHPGASTKRNLRQEVYVAEINAEALYQHSLRRILYQPLPKYPGVERDFSFVFADQITFDQIERVVGSLALSELRSFGAVEIFRGGPIAAER